MTPEEFNCLEKDQQKFLLCDADKICENSGELFKEELFKIDNVFIEVKISYLNRFRRQIKAYALSQIPVTYLLFSTHITAKSVNN
ncbi:MAG: hypothetical protein JWQ40_4471 [Segetibacter sp.]|jgi:hypothetical protein|nr:hypothetical protein [Segetibacter sp.]